MKNRIVAVHFRADWRRASRSDEVAFSLPRRSGPLCAETRHTDSVYSNLFASAVALPHRLRIYAELASVPSASRHRRSAASIPCLLRIHRP
jgi:hypothetical protein